MRPPEHNFSVSLDHENGRCFFNLLMEIQDATESLKTAIKTYPDGCVDPGQMGASITTEAFAGVIERRVEQLLIMFNENGIVAEEAQQ